MGQYPITFRVPQNTTPETIADLAGFAGDTSPEHNKETSHVTIRVERISLAPSLVSRAAAHGWIPTHAKARFA